MTSSSAHEAIAVVGMAGRFPGAASVSAFWENLCRGVESVSTFSDEELRAAGVDAALLCDPHYVRAGAVLDDIAGFDAGFFGYSAREAEVMDPQQRLFLECAWEALEDAGHDPAAFPGPVGVYAGAGLNTYLLHNLLPASAGTDAVAGFQAVVANDKDYLTTRVSYKLGLTGPSVSVQTSCSSSLVALHLACQGLLAGECDLALAGGVSLKVPQRTGYLYQEGGIVSPDGHCRVFDAEARGTVSGEGVGLVVLRRLEDALAAGDHIRALILGSAVNNDGALKVGYTAPSVAGQAKVIRAAHVAAGVDPETISYVEAHGTGTPLGDPVEVAALCDAFRAATSRPGFCALGAVKSNIGHLDAAAGIAGLIKTVLALEHRLLPPTLHFRRPNPQIAFAGSPFFVNTALTPWAPPGGVRRAGVSSFGIGGTNAHVVLQEAAAAPVPQPSARAWQLLLVSAQEPTALAAARLRLADALEADLPLPEVAYTTQVGRRAFAYRHCVLARTRAEACAALREHAAHAPEPLPASAPTLAWLFPGQGTLSPGVGRALYAQEPLFREVLQECAERLRGPLGLDVREVLWGGSSARLEATALAQPALFALEYALARQWQGWGVEPDVLLGHSLGEYVAACLAGVFSLPEALGLVALRGRLMEACRGGAMLAVAGEAAALQPLLGPELEVAALNGPTQTVLSGSAAAVAAAEQALRRQGVGSVRLPTAYAFHSARLAPLQEALAEAVARLPRQAPTRRWISNVTGEWISAAEAVDPAYWGRQMRAPVRFAAGLARLLETPQLVLLEVGPGRTLSTLARRHPAWKATQRSLSTLAEAEEEGRSLATAVGRLWSAGSRVDWARYHAGEERRRVPLPTYPFQRRRYWIEPPAAAAGAGAGAEPASEAKRAELERWFYTPVWQPAPLVGSGSAVEEGPWLVLADCGGMAQALSAQLRAAGARLTLVEPGPRRERLGPEHERMPAAERAAWVELLRELEAEGRAPRRIVHAWTLDAGQEGETLRTRGFASLLALGQALAEVALGEPVRLEVVSDRLHDVSGSEPVVPEKALLLGPCRVLPQEVARLSCRSIDLEWPGAGATPAQRERQVRRLAAELRAGPGEAEAVVALRGGRRWVQRYAATPLGEEGGEVRLRRRGVYLITGGLGGIGLALARHLARTQQARLVLSGRTGLPARDEWEGWVRGQGEERQCRRIRAVQELEELGAEVLVAAADVASREEMAALLEEVRERFGTLHGVVHAAGVPHEESLRSVREIRPEEWEQQFRPKVQGTQVLHELLGGMPLDFCLLFSSLASVLGGRGFVAYAAANQYMDALVRERNRTADTIWTTVNWDAWLPSDAPPNSASSTAMTETEGIEALRRILAQDPATQVVVSTGNLEARLARWVATQAPVDARQRDAEPAVPSSPRTPETETDAQDDVEQALAELWRDALGVAEVRRHDDFFALGGHSLLAMQLLTRIRQAFAVDLPLRALFEAPTLAALAQRLAHARLAPEPESPLRPRLHPEPPPLSFAQQRLWFLDQLDPGSPAYNLALALRLRGALRVDALEHALHRLLERHHALRTVFPLRHGTPCQVVLPPSRAPLPRVDLRALPEAERAQRVAQLAAEEAQRPFDLARGPLLRARLLRSTEEEHVLLCTMHHIVCDGWSMGILMRELSALYAAACAGRPDPLPPPALQYADFALWQRERLQGPRLEQQLAYWREQLAGAPPALDLPTDFPRSAAGSWRGASLEFELPGPLSRSLRRLADELGATTFMVLAAAFHVLLHRYSGQDDVIVGAPMANRTHEELEGCVGFFVNVLPLRGRLGANPSFRTLLLRTREVVLNAITHQDLPFERLVRELGVERDAGRPSWVQAVIDLARPRDRLALPGLEVSELRVDTGATRFDLAVLMTDDGEHLRGVWQWSLDLFRPATMANMLCHYQGLLASAAEDPDRPVLNLRLSRDEDSTAAPRTVRNVVDLAADRFAL